MHSPPRCRAHPDPNPNPDPHPNPNPDPNPDPDPDPNPNPDPDPNPDPNPNQVRHQTELFWNDLKRGHFIDARTRVVTIVLQLRSNHVGIRYRTTLMFETTSLGAVLPSITLTLSLTPTPTLTLTCAAVRPGWWSLRVRP